MLMLVDTTSFVLITLLGLGLRHSVFTGSISVSRAVEEICGPCSTMLASCIPKRLSPFIPVLLSPEPTKNFRIFFWAGIYYQSVGFDL